jgi:hypothetical protein
MHGYNVESFPCSNTDFVVTCFEFTDTLNNKLREWMILYIVIVSCKEIQIFLRRTPGMEEEKIRLFPSTVREQYSRYCNHLDRAGTECGNV